jgi:hypothetical protein
MHFCNMLYNRALVTKFKGRRLLTYNQPRCPRVLESTRSHQRPRDVKLGLQINVFECQVVGHSCLQAHSS